ncbi:MAG: DUF115 domain-containing protein [Planctomycetota bacterium]|nr:MAG: DUF115 domain-containing protein [Planctomycetota bacterium]
MKLTQQPSQQIPGDNWNLEVPIQFMEASQRDSFAESGFPPPDPEVHQLSPGALPLVFSHAANDSFRDLLVIGHAQGVVQLILSDPVLRSKRPTWIVSPGQLKYLCEEFQSWPKDCAIPRIAWCEDSAQLPAFLEHMPEAWSLALVDHRVCDHDELYRMAQTRFIRQSIGLQRLTQDLCYFFDRIPRLSGSIRLEHWRNAGAGRSAICIAAGPSLDSELDFIRQHQDRCLILAVDVVQGRLASAGIRVDFAVNVDSDEIMDERLGEPNHPDTVLVMPLLGHPKMDQRFRRHTWFGTGAVPLFALGEEPGLRTGTNVGIAAVGMALHLGCQDIVLVGYDAAYPKDSYYSSMVNADSQAERQLQSGNERFIPGNSGEPVMSNMLFEIGVQDLGLMLNGYQDATVYNININHGRGAKIPHTSELPEGWMPAGSDGPWAPQLPPQSGYDVDTQRVMTSFEDTFQKQRRILLKAMRSSLANEVNPQDIRLALRNSASTALLGGYVMYFLHGGLLQEVRLDAQPPSIRTKPARDELHGFQLQVCKNGADFILEVFDKREPWGYQLSKVTVDSRKVAFARTITEAVARPDNAPADAILLPAAARSFSAIRMVFPDTQWPSPRSALEGLLYIKAVGGIIPDKWLAETICLSVLENVVGPLDWAITTGCLPEYLLPRGGKGHPKGSAGTAVRATRAVLDIRNGIAPTPQGLDRACRWHPAHLHLVHALLPDEGPQYTYELHGLLASNRLVPDDQMIAIITHRYRDYNGLLQFLKPYTEHIGEASSAAMTCRLIEQGNLDQALGFLNRCRPLSRFRDSMSAVTIEGLLQRSSPGDTAHAIEIARNIIDPELRSDWLDQLLPQEEGLRAYIDSCLKNDHLPQASVIAAWIQQSVANSDTAILEAIEGLLQRYRKASEEETGKESGPNKEWTDLHEELFTALSQLRQRLS